MRPLLVSYSDLGGGAPRATYRIHRALLGEGVDATLAVREKLSDDPTVRSLHGWRGVWSPLATRLEALAQRLQRTENPVVHSSNLLPTRWAPQLRGDVVNLHWIGAGTLSVADVGRIRAPTIITLHDMWGFCGSEHYADDAPGVRWEVGYGPDNRPVGHRGLDLDRLAWQRKQRHWSPMHVIAPSRWMAECAGRSALMGDWPIHVVPNPLDMDVFSPKDPTAARSRLGLPLDTSIILFGALGDGHEPRKGFDLLLSALGGLSPGGSVLGVIFGEDEPVHPPRVGVPLRWMGRIDDDEVLAQLYSAADVMVVPSRQDNLPQTATEAQACGTPVVAFRTAGLTDVVRHGSTGLLVAPFSTAALADGIRQVLSDPAHGRALGAAARERAVKLWSPAVVARRYCEVYEAARSHAMRS